MAIPTFVNNGAFNSTASVTTITLALHATRTAGNAMFALVAVRNADGGHATVTAGWANVASLTEERTGLSFSVWTYTAGVDGAETGPVFTWTNGAVSSGVVVQFSGVHIADPIGIAGAFANGSSTTPSAPSVVTERADSLAVALFAVANGTVLTEATGWVEKADGGTTRIGVDTLDCASAGTTTGNADITSGSGAWLAVQFELCSIAAAADPVGPLMGSKLLGRGALGGRLAA